MRDNHFDAARAILAMLGTERTPAAMAGAMMFAEACYDLKALRRTVQAGHSVKKPAGWYG